MSAENFIEVEKTQEFENVEMTDEEIISYVRPTTEPEDEDELAAVEQKITAEEALKSLDTILSYIQNSPENIAFELKHINYIKAVKSHISGHALVSKKQKQIGSYIMSVSLIHESQMLFLFGRVCLLILSMLK